MSFFINCIKGIAIGAGAILPGISSGVFCVIFGIYEKLLDSILNFFKDIKKNLVFLMPILIGAFLGIILFGNILNYILYEYPIQTKSIFIGFILASCFEIFENTKKKYKLKIHYIFFFMFSLILGILSVMLENYLDIFSNNSTNFLYLTFCGFLMSVGVVVPGVSSTIILMLLGVYSIYLSSISTLFFPVLIPLGIGLIIGCILFMIIIKYFLDNYYIQTFLSILGFTLGSIFVLFPNYNFTSNYFPIELILSFFCIFLGYFLVSFLPKSK